VHRACFKYDNTSHEKGKFDRRFSQTREPMWTKIGVGDAVGTTTTMQNFTTIRLEFPLSPYAHSVQSDSASFLWGFGDAVQPSPLRRFSRSMRQVTSFLAKKDVPFGDLENKILYVYPYFLQKKQ